MISSDTFPYCSGYCFDFCFSGVRVYRGRAVPPAFLNIYDIHYYLVGIGGRYLCIKIENPI